MNDVEIEPEFDVILSEVPADRKLAVINTIRSITNLPLLEAKNFVGSLPRVVKEAVGYNSCRDIKQKLEAAGAKVVIKSRWQLFLLKIKLFTSHPNW